MILFLRLHRAVTGGVLALIFLSVVACGWLFWPEPFFRGYWFGLMFWTQLSVGALIVVLLYRLTGGEWGRAGGPVLRAAAGGLFVLLPLFVPALLALPHIFSWTNIELGVSSPTLVNKLAWLNPVDFVIRSGIYLAAFAALVVLWRRPTPPLWPGPALVLAIVLISFCSADWMMSLQPTFYSSLYPFLYFSGAMVSTFALLAGTTAWRQLSGAAPSNPELLLDCGKLLFAAVLFWGYIVFAQFIIIWTGNLPDEAEWYVVRSEPAWLWLTIVVLALHFAVPFCVLLSQRVKQNPRQLLAVAVLLMVMHCLEIFWLMRPTPGEGFDAGPFDVLMPLLIGAGWLWFFFRPEPPFLTQEVPGEPERA